MQISLKTFERYCYCPFPSITEILTLDGPQFKFSVLSTEMGRRNERYAYTFSAQETSGDDDDDDDDDVKTKTHRT